VSIEKHHTCTALLVCITGSIHSTPIAALELILMLSPLDIYIEGEIRQGTYRLSCCGELTRARFEHSEVFEKMTDERPSFLAFERRFMFELPPRSYWLSQETSEI
jgi:hypothetical protein